MAVNLAAMHRQTCRRLGDRPCLRHKAEGTYRDLSWAAAREQADRVAAGLLGVGIAPGDRIGMLITSGGKNIAPTEVERILVSDPYIDQAVAYGDGRNFLSALITPDLDLLRAAADKSGWDLCESDGFLSDPQVLGFFEERVAAVMEQLSSPERVKRFLLLARPFELESGEVTATLKVRRRHLIAKYEDQLAALYLNDG